MIRCIHCGQDADTLDRRVVSIDGDFVCSRKCEMDLVRSTDLFTRTVLQDERKLQSWLLGREARS